MAGRPRARPWADQRSVVRVVLGPGQLLGMPDPLLQQEAPTVRLRPSLRIKGEVCAETDKRPAEPITQPRK